MNRQSNPGRVLLVEDNQINQQIALELLAIAGIEADIACNGRVAVDTLMKADPQTYRLVLMDLQMPDMDGHEATLAIRRDLRFAQLPIIAMTAHALTDAREHALREGMQGYLTKPINPEQLYRTLEQWLDGPVTTLAPPGRLPSSGPNAPSSRQPEMGIYYVDAVRRESTQAAVTQLSKLLEEFSGDSLDYFDTVKTRLAQLLDDTTLQQLSNQIAQYEFDKARQLLRSV